MAAPTCREVRPTTSLARACWLTVWAATRTSRRSSESLRAPARTSAPHAHAIVRTQQHICMTKHKHDSSTILHTATDMPTRQRLGRAARAALGTAPTFATSFGAPAADARPQSCSRSCCMALWAAFATCWLGRPRAWTVTPRDARRLFEASMAADAGAPAASLRESHARARASSELYMACMCMVCVACMCSRGRGTCARTRISGNHGPPRPGDRERMA